MPSKKNMKDAFENFEMDPVDGGWDNLQKKMVDEGIESKKEDKKRKPFFFILASVILLGIGFLILSETDSKKKEKQEIADALMEQSSDRVENEKENEIVEAEEIITDYTRTTSSIDTDVKSQTEKQEPQKQVNNVNTPPKENDKVAEPYSKTPSFVDIDKSEKVQDVQNTESNTTQSADVSSDDGGAVANSSWSVEVDEDKESVQVETNDKDSVKIEEKSTGELTDYADSKGKVKRDTVKSKDINSRRWSFSPFFNFDRSNNTEIVNDELLGYSKLSSKSNTSNTFTYTTGFSLGIILSEKVTIESGLWIAQRKPVAETVNLQDAAGASAGSIEYNYSGKYLIIPLRVKIYQGNAKYYSPKEKFNFFYSAGLFVNKTIKTGNSNFYEQNIIGGDSFRNDIKMSKVGLGVTVSGGMEWALNSHVGVFAEILAQKSLTNVLGKPEKTPASHHKTSSYGIAPGVVIRF